MWVRLQTNLLVAMLLSVLIGHIHFNIKHQEQTEKILHYIMTLDLIQLISETACHYFNGIEMIQYKFIHEYIMISIYFLTPIIANMGPLFFFAWLEKTAHIRKKLNPILYFPIMINTVITILTIKTKWLGHINAENEYVRGPLFLELVIVCAVYIFYTVGMILKYRKYLIKAHLYVIYAIATIICASVIPQINKLGVFTIWSTIGILCVCTYIFIIYYNWMHDTLTGVESRASYAQYLRQLENRKKVTLTVISIDLDGFKKINDEFGHQEGDYALAQFARMLQSCIQLRKKVIRVGGDEFLIFIEENDQCKIMREIDTLQRSVDEFNLKNRKQYQLKFSYGISRYQKEKENIKEFLMKLDQLMYEQKNQKKHKRARNGLEYGGK